MAERNCVHCSRPMEPVHVATKIDMDVGVLYADNLWAIDGMVGDMTKAWGCRHTCGDPVPIENTPEALAEWEEAHQAAMKRLEGRPERGPDIDDDPNGVKRVNAALDNLRDAAKAGAESTCRACAGTGRIDARGPGVVSAALEHRRHHARIAHLAVEWFNPESKESCMEKDGEFQEAVMDYIDFLESRKTVGGS